MAKVLIPQDYPRIRDESDTYYGFLDESGLEQHKEMIDIETLQRIIGEAIEYASKKSSDAFFDIPDEQIGETKRKQIYEDAGKKLFSYFRKYCGDPAMTALKCSGRHYSDVAREQLANVNLQKLRMNSGWRYQHIAKNTARLSKRFEDISDIGTAEADFNVTIRQKDSGKLICIYVSVKNRTNTMGGQDWPKAIEALEAMADGDKNRNGPYLCIFGIAMDRGLRIIKKRQKTNQPYSNNTEIWLSDFFWPFFSNYSYESIVKAVVDVLRNQNKQSSLDVPVPEGIIQSFGRYCIEFKLVDADGYFYDPHSLVEFFVRRKRIRKRLVSEINSDEGNA